jgi:hypothetical protein
MKKWILRGLLIVGLLLIMVLLRTPAKHVVSYASPSFHPAVASGISGSLWNGRIDTLQHPQMRLSNINWDYRALASLVNGPGVNVTGQSDNGQFDAQAHIAWLQLNKPGSVDIQDLNAILPLADLPLPAIASAVPLSADVVAKLERLTLQAQWPTLAKGQVALADIQFKDKQNWPLGTIIADIDTIDDVIEATLSSDSEWITLQGLATLNPEGQYQVTADLQLSDQLPVVLRTMLAASGKRQTNGAIRISYQGKLPR